MATKSDNSVNQAQPEPQVKVYSKYNLDTIKSDDRCINTDQAQESREFEGSIIWNDKTFKEAIKPFLGKGIKSFFTTEKEHGYGRNSNNSSSEINSNEDPTGSGFEKKIGIFCNKDIPLNYAYDAFKDADVILVSRDKKKNKLYDVRGFVCIKLGKNARGGDDKDSIYIDLICNAAAKRGAVGRTGKEIASGKLLLNEVKKFASEAGYPKIGLKALETVIPYYYKFGWRFVESCDAPEKDWIKEDVGNLFSALRISNEEAKEQKVTEELQKFKRFLPGLSKETALRTIRYSDDDEFEDAIDANTIRAHVGSLRDNGYPMLFCSSWYDEGGKKGGKRKTRKKKRKKRSKTRRKKHHKKRTTRSKKVRKKRRKNKTRRGGGGSSSNESRSTKRARSHGVNILPTIRNDRIWSVKTNGSMSPSNRLQKHSKKKHWVSPGRHH